MSDTQMIPTTGDNSPLPERRPVLIRGGAITKNLDDIDAALVEQRAAVFQRNGQIVRPASDVVTVVDGERVEALGLSEVRATALVEIVTGCTWLGRWDVRKNEAVPINCPRDLAENYLARGRWGVRPLTGIINAPTLRPDGSLLDQPGYDRSTGLLYVPQPGMVFPPLPALADEIDAIADAHDALGTLDELICEFPLATAEARSVALAAILTSVVRRCLPTAPLFVFDANTAGSGKG
jgi:hypothetical protein